MTLYDAAGQASGAATVVGAAALLAVLAGAPAGQATVEGDVDPQAAGTAAGVATTTGAAAIVHGATGTAAGAATTTGQVGITILVTGQVAGDGDVVGSWYTAAAGTAAGSSTASGTADGTIGVRGRIFGVGTFVWAGAPLPIHGTSSMAAHVEVETHLPAIKAIVAPSKSFRYLQVLQRGDLPVYICNRNGPVSPVRVRFTLYHVRPDGSRWRVGPSLRTPAQGSVGEYYATGRAGESGQPGNWVIVWEYQHTGTSAVQTKEMDFQVLDAALAADPRDVLVRNRKYGWN